MIHFLRLGMGLIILAALCGLVIVLQAHLWILGPVVFGGVLAYVIGEAVCCMLGLDD